MQQQAGELGVAERGVGEVAAEERAVGAVEGVEVGAAQRRVLDPQVLRRGHAQEREVGAAVGDADVAQRGAGEHDPGEPTPGERHPGEGRVLQNGAGHVAVHERGVAALETGRAAARTGPPRPTGSPAAARPRRARRPRRPRPRRRRPTARPAPARQAPGRGGARHRAGRAGSSSRGGPRVEPRPRPSARGAPAFRCPHGRPDACAGTTTPVRPTGWRAPPAPARARRDGRWRGSCPARRCGCRRRGR